MTKDEIIRMAREAGLFTHKEVQPELERFAKLVAAAEREMFVEVLRQLHDSYSLTSYQGKGNNMNLQEPVCPDCKAKVLYECVACSSNNYPPQRPHGITGEKT